jgi:hypothetical protein
MSYLSLSNMRPECYKYKPNTKLIIILHSEIESVFSPVKI